MKTLTTVKSEQNSINLKKDSKGNYNWDIKIYFDENENHALNRITEIDKKLVERFKEDSSTEDESKEES